MIFLTTSSIIAGKDIDDKLKTRTYVSSICDDISVTKTGVTYLIKSGIYKIEIYFQNNNSIQYLMIEEGFEKSYNNIWVTFIDDLNLFKGNYQIKTLTKNFDQGCFKIDNVEVYIVEGKIDSLYWIATDH